MLHCSLCGTELNTDQVCSWTDLKDCAFILEADQQAIAPAKQNSIGCGIDATLWCSMLKCQQWGKVAGQGMIYCP